MISLTSITENPHIEKIKEISEKLFSIISTQIALLPPILVFAIATVFIILVLMFVTRRLGHLIDFVLLWGGIIFLVFIIPLLILEIFLSFKIQIPEFLEPLVRFYYVFFKYFSVQ